MYSELDKPQSFVIRDVFVSAYQKKKVIKSTIQDYEIVWGFFFNAAVISNMNSVSKFYSPFEKVIWHPIENLG